MKKFLILLILFFIIPSSYCQARLGDSFDTISKEYSKYNIKQSTCNDGLKALSFSLDSIVVIYYFDMYNTCTNTLIATKSKTLVKELIYHYDKSYIIVDDFTWKVTENLSVAFITRYYDEVLGYVFVWDYEDSELWSQEINQAKSINSLLAQTKE